MPLDDIHTIAAAHKAVYDTVASEYEERAAVRSASSKQRVERFTKLLTTGKSILELGCAVGQELENFRALGFEASGIELSPKMAAYAVARNPDANIIVGDFADIDFNETYDAIYAQAFIHLFPKNEAVRLVNKVYMLLKPGGVAFFGTTKSPDSEEGWIGKADYEGNLKRFRRFWTKEELETTLVIASFRIVDYYEELDLEGKDRMNITVKRE